MATVWDIIGELFDITARGEAGPPGGSRLGQGGGRTPSPAAPHPVPGRCWGQRCWVAGTPAEPPLLPSRTPRRGRPCSPGPSPRHHHHMPFSGEAPAAGEGANATPAAPRRADPRMGQTPRCHPGNSFSHWGKCHLATAGPRARMFLSPAPASALFGVLTQPGWRSKE